MKGAKFVQVSEMDIWTGRREIEDTNERSRQKTKRSILRKAKDIIIG